MLDHLLALARGPEADERKARAQLATQAEAVVRAALTEAGYEDFVGHVTQVAEPSVLLGNTEDAAREPVAVRMPVDDLAAHMVIQGATGSGKTSFATWLFATALKEGFPVGTIDCKAGFHEASIAWAAATALSLPPAEREAFVRRAVVVNPFAETLAPLNVCRIEPGSSAETQAYNVARILSGLFEAQLGVQMETILLHLLLLLTESDLTLVEAPLVLQDEVIRGILVERSANVAVRQYFGRFDRQVPSQSKEALLTRLQALLLPENVHLMLGADDCVGFKGILDRGDPLFLFLGMGPDVPKEQVDILASVILQLLFQAVTAGGLGRRRPYLLVADEFFHLMKVGVLADRFEGGLASFRAFGVHLALVMHQFSQVDSRLREAILQHSDLVALFRASSGNAQRLGDFLPDTDPEIVREALRRTGRLPARHEIRMRLQEGLQRLPDRTCYWYDRRKPYRALRLRVPDVPEPHRAVGISRRALEEFARASGLVVGACGLTKSELQRQIAARQARLRDLVSPVIHVHTAPPTAASPEPPAKGIRRPRLG